MSRLSTLAVSAVLASPLASAQELPFEVSEPGPPPPVSRFRDVAAERLDAERDEVTLGRIEGPLVLMDGELELHVASAFADPDGDKAIVALDRSGRAYDLREALADSRELARWRRGKLEKRLFDELAHAPEERVPMIAWLETPEGFEDLRLAYEHIVSDADAAGLADRDYIEFHYDQMVREAAELIGGATRAAAERFRDAGFDVVGNDELAPIVFLRANKDEVEKLERDARIVGMHFVGQRYRERLGTARGSIRASTVHATPGGNRGKYARVAVVEAGRACTTNPLLNIAGVRDTSAEESQHATNVASCIGSWHAYHLGIAPEATIYSASGASMSPGSTTFSQFQGAASAISWAIWKGASILNVSFGSSSPQAAVSAFDRYIDWIARNYSRTFTIACGNGAQTGDPGAGFNQIAVGASNDFGTTAWPDAMSSMSAWQNPTTGVEVPQVVAPGWAIGTLNCNGSLFAGLGTSYSAPIVAGAVALLVSAQPVLTFRPEAVRAIVMATAWNNIEGASRLSSMDGAGSVDALAAWRVAQRGTNGYRMGTFTPSSFDANGWSTVMNVFIPAGRTVRACLSWSSNPDGGPTYANDNLDADLDLYVQAFNVFPMASSTSSVQPFEIVEFTTIWSTNYQVKVRNRRFDGSSERYGVALTTHVDM